MFLTFQIDNQWQCLFPSIARRDNSYRRIKSKFHSNTFNDHFIFSRLERSQLFMNIDRLKHLSLPSNPERRLQLAINHVDLIKWSSDWDFSSKFSLATRIISSTSYPMSPPPAGIPVRLFSRFSASSHLPSFSVLSVRYHRIFFRPLFRPRWSFLPIMIDHFLSAKNFSWLNEPIRKT